MRSDLGDVPLPEGLAYQPAQSIVIETPKTKAVRLLYRGRMEPGSLVLEMQKALEAGGWRLLHGTSVAGHGTTQLYEKGEASLRLQIWEGGLFGFYTYIDVSGTRPSSPASTPATTAATN